MSTYFNPFKAGVYNGVQMYHQSADDRVRAAASFDRAECEAALQLPNLQKTVVTAVQRRLRFLGKPAARGAVANQALVFQLGMEAGVACFEKLPFQLSRKGDADQEDDEEDEE